MGYSIIICIFYTAARREHTYVLFVISKDKTHLHYWPNTEHKSYPNDTAS